MSARDKIANLLARAASAAHPAAGPERPLDDHDHAARRAAILAEIDETYLARALQFRLGDSSLTLEARGRRALRGTRLDPDTGEAAERRALLEAGGLKVEEECRLLAELIHHFTAADGALTVASMPSDLPPSMVEKGHAAADLAAAAPAVTTAPAAPKTKAKPAAADGALGAFAAEIAGFARSAALVDAKGKVRSEHGEGDALRLARDLAPAGLPYLQAALPGARLAFFGETDGEDALLLAAAPGQALVAEIAAADYAAAMTAWRSTGA